ncbi:MAG: hypothetical protein WKG00_28020 [Polyangiaceae bacterium]
MSSPWPIVLASLLACTMACGGDDTPGTDGAGGEGGAGSGAATGTGSGASGGDPSGAGASGTASSATGSGGGGPGPCPAAMTCVEALPFHDERDTSAEGQSLIDAYGCQPATDESGPEIYYRVLVPSAGKLTATITDGDGVDIDIHILSSIKNGQCLVRDDVTAVADVEPPYVYIAADTYVSDGVPQVGAFSIDIELAPN